MSFLERFKGKTERMPSKGIINLISNNNDSFQSHVFGLNRNPLSSLQKYSLGNLTNSQMPTHKEEFLSLTAHTQPQSPTYIMKPKNLTPLLQPIDEFNTTPEYLTVKLPQINQREKQLEFDLAKMHTELENLKLKRELVKGSKMDQSQRFSQFNQGRVDTEVNLAKSAVIQRKSNGNTLPLQQSRFGKKLNFKYSDRMKHSLKQNGQMVLETNT